MCIYVHTYTHMTTTMISQTTASGEALAGADRGGAREEGPDSAYWYHPHYYVYYCCHHC